jgi:hypothetical protein
MRVVLAVAAAATLVLVIVHLLVRERSPGSREREYADQHRQEPHGMTSAGGVCSPPSRRPLRNIAAPRYDRREGRTTDKMRRPVS